MEYSPSETKFFLWSPVADEVKVLLYESGHEGSAYCTYPMTMSDDGTWKASVKEDLHGKFYTFNVKIDGKWLGDTPGIMAKAVGVNGQRAAILDLNTTDPEGWEQDLRPALDNYADIIVYEMHHRDFSIDSVSGITNKGKFLALTEQGTKNSTGEKTGIDHLVELGVNHVHILPSYDYASVDETQLDKAQYNWGYDPVNYNVPDGSYSTDPYNPSVRIKEFKQMVQALHKAGIRVVLDVVYNHTFNTENSNFELTVPGYFYRFTKDGKLADGSGCGNETASDRAMMRKYMIQSVLHWVNEYHIDGFRFDLMGLLTVELMNRIRKELDEEFGAGEKILYGEPWRATDSPMEEGTTAALKVNVLDLDDGVAMFSDDVRDAIKGHVFFEELPGFINGGEHLEEKILGAVTAWCDNEEDEFHPKSCNQIINYISAHDNFTLWDKLVMSMHGGHGVNNEYRENVEEENDPAIFTTKYEDVMEANKLGAFIYFTCQGHLFMQAGEEYGRTKFGDGNSYRSHPEINMMRWEQTVEFSDLLEYYKGLITLRKRMPGLCDKSKEAKDRITKRTVHGKKLVSFHVDNTSDSELFVIYNANDSEEAVPMPEGNWTVLADKFDTDCSKAPVLNEDGDLVVPPCCGMMLEKK